MSYWGFAPYVSVAQRRANAARQVTQLLKAGQAVSPVVIEGRRIAASFWGKAWCDNLERYSDFANRLPRGRSYVRNGSVIDLSITEGTVAALVSGSEIYKVRVDIALATPKHWHAICADCTGSIASLIELLQGKLAKKAMERICLEGDGLFPAPKDIKMTCTCPDWAEMCKHVAAVLYGIGARFDADPDAVFTLRGVDRNELIARGADTSITKVAASNENVLIDDDMAALFGIELEPPFPAAIVTPSKVTMPKAGSGKRPARKPGATKTSREAQGEIAPQPSLASPGKRKEPSLATASQESSTPTNPSRPTQIGKPLAREKGKPGQTAVAGRKLPGDKPGM